MDQFVIFGLGFLTEDALNCFKCWCESHKNKEAGDFEKDFLNRICWCCERFMDEHPEVKVIPLGRHVPLSSATIVPNAMAHPAPRKNHVLKCEAPCGPQQLFTPPPAASRAQDSDSDSDSSESIIDHDRDGTPVCRLKTVDEGESGDICSGNESNQCHAQTRDKQWQW